MTSPYQPYPPQPGYPAPEQAYAPPQQAPQYAPQPGYPAPGPQNYAPGTAYTQPYPPQAPYGQPYAPQPQPGYAPPPVAQGPPPTVEEFFNQPASGGGKALSFNVIGTRYSGTVIRDVTAADMELATELGSRPGMQSTVAKHPDGRPKVNMKVPLLLDQPTPEYPTGIAVWYVKANERSELLRAMQAAGITEPGAPKGGDRIVIAYTHDEPSRTGFNPRKVKQVTYTRGDGTLPQLPQAPQAQQAMPPQYGPPPVQQYAPPPAPGTPQPYAPLPAYAAQQPPQQQYAPPQPPQTAQEAYFGAQAYAQPPYQQAPPTPGAAPAAPASTNGAPQTAAASPSSAPGGPPPNWPADVPFIPGLTPDQARIAATMHHPAAGQPQ